jgi:hypothetical protein
METDVSSRQVLDLPSYLQNLQVGKVQRLLQRYRVDVVAPCRRLPKTSKEVEQMSEEILYFHICICGKQWEGYTKNKLVPKSIDKDIARHNKLCYQEVEGEWHES